MKTSPTQRSLKWLREQGYTAQVVEKYNPFCKRRIDLFSCIDIVALHPNLPGCTGIQTTTKHNMKARAEKALAEKDIYLWCSCGNAFTVHGWHKFKGRWQLVLEDVYP